MKIKLLFLFCLVIVTKNSFSQTITLDTSFGVNGKVINSFAPQNDGLNSLLIQNDGKIIVSGLQDYSLSGNVFISRFNIDGTLDNSFGVNGYVLTQLVSETGGSCIIKLQNDGKILITGSKSPSVNSSFFDFATMRYNSDGTIDTSFGINGLVVTDLFATGDFSNAIDVQSDGKIIVAGSTYVGTKTVPSILRYLNNGTLDTSFGTNGKALLGLFDPNNSESTACIKVLSDNSIILGIFTSALETLEDYLNFGVIKVTNNGLLDSTFGTNGHVLTDFGFKDYIRSVDEFEGKIIALGYSSNTGVGTKMAIAKYLPNGSLDSSFGINGLVNANKNGTSLYDAISGLKVLSDGKMLCAGYTASSTADFLLIKFNVDGSVDTNFNSVGYLSTDFNGFNDLGAAVAIGNDGKIVCAGITTVGSNYDTALSRYTVESLSNEVYNENLVTVYPNPFTDSINITSKNLDFANTSVEIYDSNGKLISNFKLNSSEVSLKDILSNGNYFLKISSQGKSEIIKLIKK